MSGPTAAARRSLAARLIPSIVVFTTVIALAVTALQLYAEYRYLLDNGMLTVGASLEPARWRTAERAGFVLVANGLTTALVAAFVFVLVQRRIGHHLRTITRHVRALTGDHLQAGLALETSRNGEPAREIQDLADAFDDMQGRLDASYRALAGLNADLEAGLRDLREKESALREREGRLSAILENTVEGVIVIDRTGIVQSFNPAAERMFGYAAEAIVGRNVGMLMPEPHRGRHDRYIESYLSTGVPKIIGFGRELRGQRRDGTSFPIELAVSEIRLGEQRLFSGIVRDISERKQAEETLCRARDDLERTVVERTAELRRELAQREHAEHALRESEAQNRAVLEGVLDGIIVADQRGTIVTFNPAAERIFGFAAEEAIGRNVAMLMPEPHRSRHDGYIARYAASGEARVIGFRREVEAARRSGEVFPMDLAVSELRLDGRSLFIGVVRDISEQKRAREELRAAKDEAERANRAKSDFLSSMSHELRTPMNAILGFGQLLAHNPKEPLSAAQREYVRSILKGGEHLLDLINEVLDLAKIESGNVALSYESVTPAQVLAECREMVATMAVRHQVRLVDRGLDRTLPDVWADYTRFKQVVLNLLSNAIKYNRPQGTATLSAEQTADGMVRVMVADTGRGIPADRRDQIFKPFSRLGAETTEIEGTGIGLAISRKLVELMGGRIGFESRAGDGSTFWVDIPLAGGSSARKIREPAPEFGAEAAGVTPDGDRRTLLYVEDNPANMRLMEAIVARIPGLALLAAPNAELGLELAIAHQPELILMDINLPGMNGIQALGRLRDNPATQRIPVIAISAAAMPRDIERGLRAGFRAYLTKPIRVEQMLSVLRTFLDRPVGEFTASA